MSTELVTVFGSLITALLGLCSAFLGLILRAQSRMADRFESFQEHVYENYATKDDLRSHVDTFHG